MKAMIRLAVIVAGWGWAVNAPAQISLDLTNSSWGTGGFFSGTSASGSLLTGLEAPSGAYYGASQPDANTYVFGFVNTMTPTGAPAEYNLASTLVTAGTALHLTFTGLTAIPDYIAYTGGALTGYSYGSGTLSLTVSAVDPVASASDSTGGVLGSAFGLMIVSGSAHNFSGTVFRTDLFWDDINPLAGYAGTNFAAGLNVAGQNGVTATFNAYLPTDFLSSQGVFSPADCEARLQKDGVASAIISGLTRTVFVPTNPGFPNEGTVWTYGGASTFDFNGVAGADNYILATYANSDWSNGDIGIAAVPEPPTYALVLSGLALFAVWRRRLRSTS